MGITATLLGAATAAIWLYLIAGHGGFWRLRRLPPAAIAPPASRTVVAVIPARDEAGLIELAVASLIAQDYAAPFHIVVVDDHSSDGTASAARSAAITCGGADRLTVVAAEQMPAGWTGKLWAVDQGITIALQRRP